MSMIQNSIMAINPFIFGRIVTGEDFCPRPDAERALRSCLATRRNTLILGPRRVGKSSLIFQSCSARPVSRLIYAQLWAVKSLEDLAARMVRGMSSAAATPSMLQRLGGLLASLRPKIEFDPVTGAPSLTLAAGMAASPREIHGVFDALESLSAGGRLVVALDEFQDVALLPDADALIGEIRGRIQRQSDVTYLFAGSIRHRLEGLFTHPGSPFFKAVEVLEVGGLDDALFRNYLRERFERGKRRTDDAFLDSVLDTADRIPSDVQQLCSSLWEVTREKQTLGPADLGAGIGRLIAGRRGTYEAMVHPLTDIQMRVLRTVARRGGQEPQSRGFIEESGVRLPASIKRALLRLSELEMLFNDRGIWRFFDPFFRAWIRSA
jgi:hypothetical protein